jgi:hypothetical protein
VKEAKELAAATFRPDLSPSTQRAGEPFAVSSDTHHSTSSKGKQLRLEGFKPTLQATCLQCK